MSISFHFSGIGGSGMAPLAYLMYRLGYSVSGSDRLIDRGIYPEVVRWTRHSPVKIVPQDGSGVGAKLDFLVVSSAIERSNPEIQRAVELGVPVVKRAVLLSNLFNTGKGIAIAGTSGKSTVTSMLYHIVRGSLNPTYLCGAEYVSQEFGEETGRPLNVFSGKKDLFLVETDESDRTLVLFKPSLSLITNISLDHHPLEELAGIFQEFVDQTYHCLVLNSDCPVSARLKTGRLELVHFGMHSGDFVPVDIESTLLSSTFRINSVPFELSVPGLHNVLNATAAAAAATTLGVSLEESAERIRTYPGIRRRFEQVYTGKRISIIDDFAHNPDKIRAILLSTSGYAGHRIVIFQPHGFGPLRLFFEELVDVFQSCLSSGDHLVMLPVYYAGGTTDTSVTSRHVADKLKGIPVEVVPKARLLSHLCSLFRFSNSNILTLLLGARDPELPLIASRMGCLARQIEQEETTDDRTD